MFDLINTAQAAEEAVHAVAETAITTEDQGVIGLLGLDIKLFIAQLINFGLVFLILWKWVFKPVVGALRSRQEKIEKSLADAKKIEQKVQDLEDYKKKQLEQANRDYQKVITKAEDMAKQQKAEVLKETKSQAERMIKDSEGRIGADKKRMITEAKGELAALVVAASEKVISEKLDQKKDEQLIKESLKNLS